MATLATSAAGTAAAPAYQITNRDVGGVRLGATRAQYVRALGRPSYAHRLGDGLTRLAFAKRELFVYLAHGRGVAVLTSAEEYRTAKKIGPCSTKRALVRAYGGRLQPYRRSGRVVAYRIRNLVFAVPSGRVGAVLLANRHTGAQLAVNASQCGTPGEE